MTSPSTSTEDRGRTYAQSRGIEIQRFLGAGYDGTVFATNRKSAIKALNWSELYQCERNIYFRLEQHQIRKIVGCNVPRLMSYDDDLWVLEMTIVSPPYVLDFAGARLDHTNDYPPDIRRQWEREKRIQFGSNWQYVPRIVVAFQRMGIYLSDLNPGNVCLTGYKPPPDR